jgi:capsid protein
MAKRATKPKPARAGGIVHTPRMPARAVVRARYDAAQTTPDNQQHWAATDGMSPDASAGAAVRQTLRNRCRYEYANNSYAKGVVDTLATDCVGGTGPRLQMLTDDDELNEAVEQDFADWAEEVRLAETLRTMRAARAHSGEAFGLMATNPGLASDVKLDVSLVEADQITDPFTFLPTDSVVDGIEFDRYGNPRTYSVLRYHPGGLAVAGLYGRDDFDSWPAKFVLHYYRPDRPGQHRGVPDLTPAIQLFAELRRYCAAVIAAAETAADFAAVLYSDSPPEEGTATTEIAAMDTVELTRRMATVVPQGWKLGQVSAEQPVTTYGDFVDKKLEEIARCLGMPWTIAALNSSKANMSASYLDGQRYANAVAVDRARLEVQLNRLLDTWLTEWRKVRDVPPSRLPDRFPHQWFWPSLGHHADPGKVASARTEALKNGTTTIAYEYAREGRDWEKEQESAAKSLGVSLPEYRKLVVQGIFGPPPAPPAAKATEDASEADGEEEAAETADEAR